MHNLSDSTVHYSTQCTCHLSLAQPYAVSGTRSRGTAGTCRDTDALQVSNDTDAGFTSKPMDTDDK